jgi:phycocyanobilin:ferredoxin oxidoreductase
MNSPSELIDSVFSKIVNRLDSRHTRYTIPENEIFNRPGMQDITWRSDLFRKAHVNRLSESEVTGMQMLHCCIYPHYNNSSPIFGLDIIAGRNKITGLFMDFSPTIDRNHPLISEFSSRSKSLNFSKVRELPEWARSIFSEAIIAAGNIQERTELVSIEQLCLDLFDSYLSKIVDYSDRDHNSTDAQNFYARQQKKNPRTKNNRIMSILGFSDEEADRFIEQCLFPEY